MNLLVLFSVITLVAFVAAAEAGNCSALTATEVLTVTGQHFTIDSFGVVARPFKDGAALEDIYIAYHLFGATERSRVYLNLDRETNRLNNSCVAPRYDPGAVSAFNSSVCGSGYRPFANCSEHIPCVGFEDVECGSLLLAVVPEDLDCWMERVEDEPFLTTTRTAVYVHYTLPGHPQFKMSFGSFLVKDPVDDMPFLAANLSSTYQYRPDRLKVNLLVNDWPWQGPEDVVPGYNNTGSFWSIYFAVDYKTVGGKIDYNNTIDYLELNFTSADKTLHFNGVIEKGFTTDRNFSLISRTDEIYNPGITIDEGIQVSVIIGISVCNPLLGYWTEGYYDPSFSVLFSPPPVPDSPITKKSRTTVIAASVASASVVIVAIVIVILLFTIGPFKYYFKDPLPKEVPVDIRPPLAPRI